MRYSDHIPTYRLRNADRRYPGRVLSRSGTKRIICHICLHTRSIPVNPDRSSGSNLQAQDWYISSQTELHGILPADWVLRVSASSESLPSSTGWALRISSIGIPFFSSACSAPATIPIKRRNRRILNGYSHNLSPYSPRAERESLSELINIAVPFCPEDPGSLTW